MSRPARKLVGAGTLSGGASASPAAVPVPLASPEVVTALVECIIAGVRRFPGERFAVPADRAPRLTALGHVLPTDAFAALPPAAAALWRQQSRPALTDASLVCDDATAARLWASAGRLLSPDGVPTTYPAAPVAPDALRVLQLTHYDPGSAVYRYHSAANTVPGVVSAFARWGYSNPHCDLRQWDGDLHRRTVELLALTADVIHVHMDWRMLDHELRYALAATQRAAITYHGSVLPDDPPTRVLVDHARDARRQALQFGARPYHARFGVSRYLPIPVPVADYAALAAAAERPEGAAFRIAHSPTRRAIKGTTEFLAAVDGLRDEGVRVEAVLIEGLEHGAALRVKATCDATFDSFWLGMQGSGLEAAAMGQPVLAGDAAAAAEAAALNDGVCPWTFAEGREALRDAIRRLAKDPPFHAAEAARVGAYVRRVHDYPAVGAQYRTYLTEGVGRGAANRR